MLELCNIVKNYKMADSTVHALKGISINFRNSEFVAVLGPSGCGKTTMLNIVGGLDGYTDGDLIIDDKSTKDYRSREWDRYRNKRVGFIFQSYNLIPHLNVLQNVELALTISGVGPGKKKSLASEALIRVGLDGQFKKKPSQLSGGQMQRVAIARAIVNNPDIILADEPTGALDSVSSQQIMDLLQEISDDRLVIMVTHNPELASRYATRIVHLYDGEITQDSNPYDGLPTIITPVKPVNAQAEDAQNGNGQNAEDTADILSRQETRRAKRQKKRALTTNKLSDDQKSNNGASLNLNPPENVLNEKGSLTADFDKPSADLLARGDDFGSQNNDSEGEKNPLGDKYVAKIIPDTPQPLSKMTKQPKEKKGRSSMSLFTAISLSARNLFTKKARTTLTAFAGSIGIIGIALVLSLSNGFNIYMARLEETTIATMPITITNVGIKVNVNEAVSMFDTEGEFPETDYVIPYEPNQSMAGIKVSANIITEEYVNYVKGINKSLLSSVQYLHSINVAVLGRDTNNNVLKISTGNVNWQELLWDDFMKSQYDVLKGGYPGTAVADTVMQDADSNYLSYTESSDKRARQAVLVVSSFNTIDKDILQGLGYSVVRDPETNSYEPIKFEDLLGKQFQVMHNDDYYQKASGTDFYYTRGNFGNAWDLEKNTTLTIVGVMRVKPDILFPFLSTGLAYTEDLTKLLLNNAAQSNIAVDQTKEENHDRNLLKSGASFGADFSSIVSMFSAYGMNEATLVGYLKTYVADAVDEMYPGNENAEQRASILEQVNACTTFDDLIDVIVDETNMTVLQLKTTMAFLVNQYLGLDFNVVFKLLDRGYTSQLQKIGAIDMPTALYLYPKSFAAKADVLDYLDAWNVDKPSTETVTYTDLAGTVSEIVRQMVQIVTYILIAFSAISLIVSSIMISIITYVSVLERTTEIGVLRSIGARKIDISNVFNAETSLIGLASGSVGIFLAWIIDYPLNAWISSLSPDIPRHFAQLNGLHALLLIALAIVLNIISGIVPAIYAARKDPVKALRSNG